MPFGLGRSDNQDEDTPGVVDAPGAYDTPQPADSGSVDGSGGPIGGNGVSPTAFRQDFPEPTSPQGGQAPRLTKTDMFFVTVDRNGATEVHRFDDAAEAQGFVAQALEEGVPEDGVAAFSGTRLALKVSHRPAVKLVGGDSE